MRRSLKAVERIQIWVNEGEKLDCGVALGEAFVAGGAMIGGGALEAEEVRVK